MANALKPTMRLRLVPREDDYHYKAYYYECASSEPILVLQQWWEWPEGKDELGYPSDGEWRNVPIEERP